MKVSILPKMIIHIAFNDQKLFFNTDKNMGNQLHRPLCKVEKILKGSLDSIPSLSVKIQIMGGKVCMRCKGKTLLVIVNEFTKRKSLLTSPGNPLPYYYK